MDTMRTCQHCCKPVGQNAIGGLCPECMMKVGLGSGVQSASGKVEKAQKHFALPSNAEVTKHFPQLEILELLGQGGMGAVYKARQSTLDRVVALKILPLEGGADPGFAERFTREARALAKLSHPNIVAVHEFGQVNGLHYLIMEYVDGLNLRQFEQAGKLSPRQALQIIPQICEALQFAHDEGVVHRDIKPENVLLDKKGRVKIADFGLAKILGREPKDLRLTGAKDVMGTPHYMAPEQIEHPHEVDHRADIYSLGVVFYEMLTGELPLGKFQPPSRKVQVDVRLDEIVLHALEKEPDRRYQHASEVKTDVETIASTPQPSEPTRPGSPELTGVPSTERERIRREVRGPAIGLLVAGILNWILVPVAVGVIRWIVPLEWKSLELTLSSTAVTSACVASLALCSFIIYAALKIQRLEAHGAGLWAGVLAIVVAPGNIVGLPIGVWTLVVLSRREVRAAFSELSHGPSPPANSGVASPRPLWHRAAIASLLVGLACFGVLAMVTMLAPRTYEAKAKIRVEDDKLSAARSDRELDWMLRDVVWSFRSPATLDHVAADLDLQKAWADRFGSPDLKEGETRALLERQLFIERIPRTTTFEIRFLSTLPAEAAEIANKAAEVFCASSSGRNASVIERAEVPRKHMRPNEPLNLTFAAAIGLGLAIVTGAAVLLASALGLRPTGPPRSPVGDAPVPRASGARQKEASGARSHWITAARWTARVLGTLLLAFYGLFLLAEGLPPIASQPEGVQLNFVALGLMLLGFIVGWKSEGAAALLIALGWTVWHVSEGPIRWNFFQTPLPVAMLYGFCWWAMQGRKTGMIVGTAMGLAALLGFGRLFVPTSVFVRGKVVNSETGTPVPNAELRLLPRPPRSLEKGDRPNARAGQDGRFTLYVGWYGEQTGLGISAPGYLTLSTNLGPRALGQRSVSREFQLHRVVSAAIETKAPPVVVETFPESGATNVDPALTELRVTFSKPMRDRNWSWVKLDDPSCPQINGEPRFLENCRTCVLPVKLEPAKTYASWINADSFRNFQDKAGRPAVPYLLIFETRK
jgi:capsular polysaccharide biosynthesis protein